MERIVELLKKVHLSLDYELSGSGPYPWTWQIIRLYGRRDELLHQLKAHRKGRVTPSKPWPRR